MTNNAKTKTPAHTTGAATRERRPFGETARLGKEIYESSIRHLVEADHVGEFVLIDVDSGDWIITDDELVVVERLREKRPDAVNLYCERVGYLALRSYGAGSLRRTD